MMLVMVTSPMLSCRIFPPPLGRSVVARAVLRQHNGHRHGAPSQAWRRHRLSESGAIVRYFSSHAGTRLSASLRAAGLVPPWALPDGSTVLTRPVRRRIGELARSNS